LNFYFQNLTSGTPKKTFWAILKKQLPLHEKSLKEENSTKGGFVFGFFGLNVEPIFQI